MEQRHPKHCTTRGIGELIRIATANAAGAILLGIGGSATSDLGLGALQALGIQFPNTDDAILPEKWHQVHSITGFLDCKLPPIYIACDVDNPLTGARGAASGLWTSERPSTRRNRRLRHRSGALGRLTLPTLRASGGFKADTGCRRCRRHPGFGLKVACGAEFLAGFDLVESWLELENKVSEADLILTGEGKFDRSSLAGKGPFALISAAERFKTKTIVLAGKAEPDAVRAVRERFQNCIVKGITPDGINLETALQQGAQNLATCTAQVLSGS